jgi:hypothetical protein
MHHTRLCENLTLRVEITIVRVDITLLRIEVTLYIRVDRTFWGA